MPDNTVALVLLKNSVPYLMLSSWLYRIIHPGSRIIVMMTMVVIIIITINNNNSSSSNNNNNANNSTL